MDEHTVNLNHNSAQCIHSITYWGETVYQNICNGSLAHVPWGSGDYALAIFFYCLAAVLVLGAISVALAVASEFLS